MLFRGGAGAAGRDGGGSSRASRSQGFPTSQTHLLAGLLDLLHQEQLVGSPLLVVNAVLRHRGGPGRSIVGGWDFHLCGDSAGYPGSKRSERVEPGSRQCGVLASRVGVRVGVREVVKSVGSWAGRARSRSLLSAFLPSSSFTQETVPGSGSAWSLGPALG